MERVLRGHSWVRFVRGVAVADDVDGPVVVVAVVGVDSVWHGPPSFWENILIEEVFEQLKCSRDGLTSTEGENRLQIFGFNKLEEKK
ncbi:hypothetical protein Droror1_Dr00004817, partial [Drosera rotundifolia]